MMLCVSLLAFPASAVSELQASMEVNCGSCLLVDLDTDTVLYGQSNDEQIFPASVTKILTALVVLQHEAAGDLSLSDTVTASDTFTQGLTSEASVGEIETGEILSYKDLLYMLLLPSHCDAANVLAESVSGSIENFAAEMNQTAASLGCTGSNFVNPSGLHNKNHYTTCDDLYLIAKAAYQYETFRTIIGTEHYTVPATNRHEERDLYNTNALITDHSYSTYLYEPCVGGKTGSTYLAGYCLLSFAEEDGRTLCCVMMGCNWLINLDGSKDRLQFSESVRLYQWGFENFATQTIVDAGTSEGEVSVTGTEDADSVSVQTAQALTALIPNDIGPEDFEIQVALPDTVEAPVSTGDKLGTLTISLDGTDYGTADLVAVSDVGVDRAQKDSGDTSTDAGKAPSLLFRIFQVLGGLLGLVILFFLVQAFRRRINRRRRRYHHGGRNGRSYRGRGRR